MLQDETLLQGVSPFRSQKFSAIYHCPDQSPLISAKAQSGLTAALGFMPSDVSDGFTHRLRKECSAHLRASHRMEPDFESSNFHEESGRHSFHPRFSLTPCPACRSARVVDRAIGKQAGAAIGAVAGAASGISGVMSGAAAGGEVGAVLGAIAGPAGVPVGVVAGCILGGLSGGIAGCAIGAALGEAVDEAVLCNRRCLDCGHVFSVPRR